MSEGNSKSHLWYAILLGDTCKYDDTRVKLTKGLEFEKQVKLSLDIDPYNSTALHLIGRYCFEVRFCHSLSFNKSVLDYYYTRVTRAYGRDFTITVEMQKYSPALYNMHNIVV